MRVATKGVRARVIPLSLFFFSTANTNTKYKYKTANTKQPNTTTFQETREKQPMKTANTKRNPDHFPS